MNAGFSSLTALKKSVIPSALRSRTDFDDQLVDIGLGVAGMIEGFLGRSLAWEEGAQEMFPADQLHFGLSRYPITTLEAVEIQGSGESTWEDITDDAARTEKAAGLIQFASLPGSRHDTIRVTFDGGFWWDDSEDASGTLPTGATRLPSALKLAWIAQVQAVVEALKLTGPQAATSKDKEQAAILSAELLPGVKTMLDAFRRMS